MTITIKIKSNTFYDPVGSMYQGDLEMGKLPKNDLAWRLAEGLEIELFLNGIIRIPDLSKL